MPQSKKINPSNTETDCEIDKERNYDETHEFDEEMDNLYNQDYNYISMIGLPIQYLEKNDMYRKISCPILNWKPQKIQKVYTQYF